MEQSKVDLFMATMGDKFPTENFMLVRAQMEKMDDSRFAYMQSLEYKNPVVLLIVSLFFGTLGIDRFMLGEIGLGLAKLLTCGGLGLWTLIDWFLIMDRTKELNYIMFMQHAQ